jgi:RimJ/RimL family protein N-acetyltransferase
MAAQQTSTGRTMAEWPAADGLLRAYEPRPDEVAAAAPELAAYYNDAHNSAMMAHQTVMSVADVLEHFERLRSEGGRPFLLEWDGRLMGDADLRHVAGGCAELAIMVGPRASQGKGLGTRFALMLHALAFRTLGLKRIYVTIIPANHASQRLFARLGYEPDDGPAARAYADEDDDIAMSFSRARFEELHAATVADVRCGERAL